MFTFSSVSSRTKVILGSGILFAILSLFLPIFGFLGFIGIVTLMILSVKTFSLVESIALSILLFFIGAVGIYSLVTLFGLHLPVKYGPVALILAALILSVRHLLKSPSVRFKLINRTDIYALAAVVVCLFYMLFPIHLLGGGDKIAQFLSYGEDNASHYALTNYTYQYGSFAYRTSSENNGVYKSLEIYPQGFHINAATFVGLAKPFSISAAAFVKLYALFIACVYAFLSFWIVKAGFGVIRKRSLPFELSLLPGYFLLVTFGYPLLLLDRGFQSQIFTYLFLFAMFFIAQLSYSRNGTIHRSALLLLLLALTIGIASSWWLLLPLAAICICMYMLRSFKLEEVTPWLRKYWFYISACILTILYPIIVNVLLNQKVSPINEPGGVDNIPVSIFVYLTPLILLGTPFLARNFKHYALLLGMWFGSVGLTLVIGAYQLITVSELRYFFYKAVYTTLLFTLIVSLVSVIEFLQWITRHRRLFQYIACCILLITTFVLAVRTNLVFIKVYTHVWFPNAVQPDDLSVLFDSDAERFNDILFVGGCQPGRAYLSNRWSGARLLSESPNHTHLELSGLDGLPDEVSKTLRHLPTHDKIYKLVVFGDCPENIPDLSTLPGATYTIVNLP